MSEQGGNRNSFDFKRHQESKQNYRMLVRFLLYGAVLGLILYLIFQKEKESSRIQKDSSIENFEIDSTGSPLE
ncbi:MAG: hypothetical protein R3277_11785 [Brumimicrobium sp.]|nr:hypothetical protein [Brumimicrobium sp.]